MILTAALSGSLMSQSADSAALKRETKRQQSGFVDQDGDGIPDAPQGEGKKRMRRDQFVDTNGDGICDSREQGLGFQRTRKQQADRPGKQNRKGKK